MTLSKRITDFHKRGMQAVKRAAEAQNKPSHYVGNGGYNGYERIVTNKTFNPVHGNAATDYASNYASNYSAPNYNSSGSTFTKAPSATAVSAAPSASKASAAPRAQANTEEFNSPWSDKLQAMYDQIANRPKFSYDQASDPLYQQYAEMYRRNAQLAMDDTVGRAAALTGGYGNSYAETAGQAMYNQQMDNLNARALDLYNAALDTYEAENQNLYNKFNLAGQMYNNDYNEWRARIADSQWAQNYDFNAWQADVANQQWADNYRFNAWQADTANQQWADNYNFNAWQADTANQQWQTQFDYDRYLNDRNYNYQLDRDRVADERYENETEYNRRQNDLDRALQYFQARYDPETGGLSELGRKERDYEREQNDLDRALQYYQAGYDPATGGMSAEARQQYRDELALNYAKLGMNPDGSLNAIGRANSYEELYKEQVAAASGETPNVQEFIKKKGRTGNNTNIDGILTRTDFNRTVKEGHEAHVIGKDDKGKTKGKGYTNYEDYVTAWLNTQPQLSEAEAIYLFDYYTSQEETKKKSTKK